MHSPRFDVDQTRTKMVFNEKKSDERLHELRAREEEQLAEMLSQNTASITSISLQIDRHRRAASHREAEARATEVGPSIRSTSGFRRHARARAPDALQVVGNLERLGYSVRDSSSRSQSLEHAWDRYHDISYATETEAGILTLSNETIQEMLQKLKTLADVRVEIAVARRLQRHAPHLARPRNHHGGALSLGASDVHLEPEEEGVRMRYRLDGVLVEVLMFDQPTYALISSRIKLLSGSSSI
jgi:type II secretory ATPase GspE/PulE/Tfp pilus assembly ATPase PilB-like protein